MSTIVSIDVRLFHIPLAEVLVDMNLHRPITLL